jgi:hypothetical protein
VEPFKQPVLVESFRCLHFLLHPVNNEAISVTVVPFGVYKSF